MRLAALFSEAKARVLASAGFLRDRRGGVAIIFALCLAPLSMLGLTAIDLNRASSAKLALQDSLDAAALAAARSTATTTAAINTAGLKVLKSNLVQTNGVTLDTSATSFNLASDGTVTGSAQATLTPIVLGLFLGHDIVVSADSTVVRANSKLEIALVLDNTQSMSGTKITNLKTAATNFVTTFQTAAAQSTDNTAIKISLVPFAATVKVGSTYSSAAWIDNTTTANGNSDLFSGSVNRISLFTTLGFTWGGCVEERIYPYDVQDTAPSTSIKNSMFVPYFAPDEPDLDDYSTNSYWKSYYVDNDYINDTLSKKTISSSASASTEYFRQEKDSTKYKKANLKGTSSGPNNGCDMQALMRLGTNFTGLKTAISTMVATGNTNIPMGLAWGWHTLSPNAPFADGAAYGASQLQKVVVLMTDGANTETQINNPNGSYYSGLGYAWQGRLGLTASSSEAARNTVMNSRMSELCTNMKAKGIIIYVIGVGVDSDTKAALQSCATSYDDYTDVTDYDDITAAFSNIAGKIDNLRLSQ